jgi:hypothetical protein
MSPHPWRGRLGGYGAGAPLLPHRFSSTSAAAARDRRRLPDGQFAHATHAQSARRANMPHADALAASGKSRAPFRPSRGLAEGRFAIVTNVGCGMRWTRPRVRRSSRSRTEKSCGPGAPTLALSSWSAQRALWGRRGQESPVPGESTKDTVKTIAQGRPDDLAEPVVTPPAFCLQADHGCGQHPAFPAPSRFSRAMLARARTRNAPRECGRTFSLMRSAV